MKLLRRMGIVFFLAPSLVIVCMANARADNPADAVVLSTRGYAVAKFKTASTLVPLVKGARLGVGDTIETGDGGKVQLKLPDKSMIVIGANSWVVIKELGTVEVSKVYASTFELLEGKIRAVVTHLINKDSRFTIETNNTTAGVRGTDFGMTYDAVIDTTYLLTIEGSVYITLANFPHLPPISVTGGEEISVLGDTQPSKPSRAAGETIFEFLGEMGIFGDGGNHGGGDRGGGRGGEGGN